jgi:peptide-methionine (R)-S-oxide reductase
MHRYHANSHRSTRRSLFAALGALALAPAAAAGAATANVDRVVLDDASWRRRLSPEAYAVLRHESTEPPFSSPLDHEKRAGTFACAGCDLALFSSKTKFDSGTGWPSFYAPLPNAVATKTDRELAYEPRVEVHCRRCDGHLGHVFDDGPKPTGKRYCMNGVSLKFKPAG